MDHQIQSSTEFIDDKPRQVLYLQPKGRVEYNSFKRVLQELI